MSAGQVKDPSLWTVDEIVGIIPNVLHDAAAVETLIRMLAVRDPHRAQEVLDTIELGVFVASRAGDPR